MYFDVIIERWSRRQNLQLIILELLWALREKDRACVVRWQRQWGYIYFCDMVFFGAYIRYISMLLVCVLCLVGGRCFLIRRLHAIFRTQQHPIWPPVLSPYGQTCRFIILCNHSADSFCQTGAIFLSCLQMFIHLLRVDF